jgi:hypothetical protein
MCIQDDVSTRITGSTLAARSLKFLRRDQVGAGAGVFGEFRHAHAAIEVGDGADDGIAFGLRLRESDSILKFVVGNINSRFHACKISSIGSAVKPYNIPNNHFSASMTRQRADRAVFASIRFVAKTLQGNRDPLAFELDDRLAARSSPVVPDERDARFTYRYSPCSAM